MTDTLVAEAPPLQPMRLEESTALRPFLPALVVLFVGSGCAALIYEIVWLQLLGLVIGASAISLGVLLGTFMGGMCIGSLLFPKLVSRRLHPLVVYGALEFAIGVIGLLEPWLIHVATDLYTHIAQPGAGAIALRSTIAAICLLPPTILMGATLPAIARYVESTPRGVSWLGFFYGGNIVGAVIGCLTAGFYLLPNFNMAIATRWAVVINVAVALLAWLLAAVTTHRSEEKELSPAAEVMAAPGAWSVYVAIGLSGLTGLGAEVVWTRQLSLMLGATVYTFSNILAVFLLGLGIGSSVGSFIARGVKQPRAALGWCQLLLAGAIAWAAYSISYSLPFWPINPTLTADRPWFNFQLNLAQCFWAVLPGALLWGASFPLALAGVARRGQDPGKLVGSVYAANTIGAILGSMVFTLLVMPYLGSQNAQRCLVALCVLSGVVAILPLLVRLSASAQNKSDESSPATMGTLAVGLVLSVLVAGWLIFSIGGPNWSAVAWGRNSATEMINEAAYPALLTYQEYESLRDASVHSFSDLHLENGQLKYILNPALPDQEKTNSMAWIGAHGANLTSALAKRQAVTGTANALAYGDKGNPNWYCVYVGEGMNVSVAVTYDNSGYRYFHGAGKVQASSNPQDMRLQRTLGHISALTYYAQAKRDPEEVLVVACGAGVTAGSFVPYKSKITIVDIEEMVPHFVTPQFADMNHHVIPNKVSGLNDPLAYDKTNVIIDDGRHYIRTTNKKFDVITSDPIDPWVKGCAALNTVEYYQMCRDHLNPGGIMALWIPLYESSEDTSKSVIATFFKVFPNGILWSNDQEGNGYDAVLFGSVPPTGQKDDTLHLNIDEIQAYLDAPGHEKIKESIQYVGYGKRGIPGTCEAVELLATFAGTAPRMTHWIETPSETKIPTKDLINYDSNLRLQYVAGMGVNRYDEGVIFNKILRDYSFPDEIFSGTPERMAALKEVLSQTGRHDRN